MDTGSLAVRRKGTAFAVLTATSFLVQYFTGIFGTYVPYVALLLLALAVLVYSSGFVLRFSQRLTSSAWWIPALAAIFISVVNGGFIMSSNMELITYVICALFLFGSGKDEAVFERPLRVIKSFAFFYAVSVWIQLLLPPVYDIFLGLLTPTVQANIQAFEANRSSYTGFSTNVGFTAGHVCAGLMLCFSQFFSKQHLNRKKLIFEILFLMATLFLTNKRGHMLALFIVAVVIYLVSAQGSTRFTRFNKILVIGVIGLVVLLLGGEALSFIPGFNRIAETITGLMVGEDVTSGRSGLYEFAKQMIRQHTWDGIGWGQFRLNTIGNVTVSTQLDVHNIYLQSLCEMGIICFVFLMIALAAFLIKTYKLITAENKKQEGDPVIKMLLLFSLAYQIFFLIYGLTGNPLYDHNYIILYMFACAISAVIGKRNYLLARRPHAVAAVQQEEGASAE